jgi:hypothetical protein
MYANGKCMQNGQEGALQEARAAAEDMMDAAITACDVQAQQLQLWLGTTLLRRTDIVWMATRDDELRHAM